MEFSQWKNVPLDIIREQFYYLHTADQFKKICEDPVIFEKICQDGNHPIWQELFVRDLSDEIKLDKGETVMDQYLRDIGLLENMKYARQFDFAVNNGYEKILQNIIENFPSRFDRELYPALLSAVKNGHLGIVKYLHEKLGVSIHHNFDGPLRSASQYGHLPIIEYLVENGADVNIFGEPLHFAARKAIKDGDNSIIEYLISQGADVSTAIRVNKTYESSRNVIDLLKRYLPKLY